MTKSEPANDEKYGKLNMRNAQSYRSNQIKSN